MFLASRISHLASRFSMRHSIRHDVDSEWVGFFDGELFEVPRVFAFAFPAVAQVSIVANKDHDSVRIVPNATVMRNAIVRSVASAFPCYARCPAILSMTDTWQLRLFLKVVYAMEYLVFKRNFGRFSVWENAFDFTVEIKVLLVTPKIVYH